MPVNYFTIVYWFCHTSTWIRHTYARVPHPEPSLFPPRTIPLGHPSAQASCILHRTWTGDSFHIWYYTCFNAILPNHPTFALSHRVQRLFYTSVSLLLSGIQGYSYHLSKFHIYVLVYCIGVFLSGILFLWLQCKLPKRTRLFESFYSFSSVLHIRIIVYTFAIIFPSFIIQELFTRYQLFNNCWDSLGIKLWTRQTRSLSLWGSGGEAGKNQVNEGKWIANCS